MATRRTANKKTTTKSVAKKTTKSAMALPDELASEFAAHISRDRTTVVASSGWPIVRASAQGFKIGSEPLPGLYPTIVLGGMRQNVLFEGAYNPANPSMPTCAAVDVDGDESTMAPPPGIGKSDLCSTCDFNAWGSGQGRGKACKNQLKVAHVPYYEDADYTKGGRGAILNLPPTSLKLWAEYAGHVLDDIGRPLFSVITNFEVTVLSQGFTIEPSFGGVINNAATLRALAERADTDVRKALVQLPPIDEEAEPSKAPTPAKGGAKRRKVQRRK